MERREGIILQNAREARAQQNQALAIALTLVVIAWTAGTAGGIWISHSITRPIRSLVSATEAISRGDLTTRTSMPGADELASLGSAMNQMVSDLAQSKETTERLTTQLRDSVDSLEQRVAERTRELEKLEELGRAIINAPPDASTLPHVLREYLPDMFPDSRIDICIFPAHRPSYTIPMVSHQSQLRSGNGCARHLRHTTSCREQHCPGRNNRPATLWW